MSTRLFSDVRRQTFAWFTCLGVHALPVFALLHSDLPNRFCSCLRRNHRGELRRSLAKKYASNCERRVRYGIKVIATLWKFESETQNVTN